jgi:hypothetical protein
MKNNSTKVILKLKNFDKTKSIEESEELKIYSTTYEGTSIAERSTENKNFNACTVLSHLYGAYVIKV